MRGADQLAESTLQFQRRRVRFVFVPAGYEPEPIDGRSESFLKFWASTRRASFLKRLVEHHYEFLVDPDGTVRRQDAAAPEARDE